MFSGAARAGGPVVAVLAVALASGCGDSPPVAPADSTGSTSQPAAAAGPSPPSHSTGLSASGSWSVANSPDACRTITAAQVNGILGVHVGKGVASDSWPPLCAWLLAVGGATQEYMYTSDNSNVDTATADFTRERSSARAAEPVEGLGDQAFWVPDTTALNVMAGQTYVVVKFGGATPPAHAKRKAIAVARITVPASGPASGPAATK